MVAIKSERPIAKFTSASNSNRLPTARNAASVVDHTMGRDQRNKIFFLSDKALLLSRGRLYPRGILGFFFFGCQRCGLVIYLPGKFKLTYGHF